MATSSFTKNFVVSAKKAGDFMAKMQDDAPVTKFKGFTPKLMNLKDVNINKSTKNDKK